MSPQPLSGGNAAPISTAPTSGNSEDWNSPLEDDESVLHVLNRVTFGPRPGDLGRVRQMGVKAFIDQQLHPESIDDSAMEARLAGLPTLSMSSEQLVEDFPRPRPANKPAQQKGERIQTVKATITPEPMAERPRPKMEVGDLEGPRRVMMELAQEEVLRAIGSERQLHEVMVQFWMNHFNIFVPKGADLWLTTSFERDAIRPHTLGKFEDLLVATAKSPAMLFYLDNWLSATPNPTFIPRRRPMRGFGPRGPLRPFGPPVGGFGMGPFGPMAESRNPNIMRNPAARRPVNRPRRGLNENYGRELMELHTLGVNGGYTQKDVIEVARCLTGWSIDRPQMGGKFIFRPQMHDYGSKVVLGHKIKSGRGMEDGLQVLHLLAHHPSTAHFISLKLCRRFVADTPPPSVVGRASKKFQSSKGNIREVVKTILTSPEFNSRDAYRSKIKTPIELAASSVRALGGGDDVDVNLPLLYTIARMGEPMFQYLAPSGYPDRGNTWINSGALMSRIAFARQLMSNHFPGLESESADFESGIEDALLDDEVDAVSTRLLNDPLSSATRQAILKSLSSTDQNDLPKRDGNFARPNVPLIASLVLASPEFQMK